MSNELKIFKKPKSPNWYVRGTIHGQEIYESSGIPHKGLKTPSTQIKDYRDRRISELREAYIYGKAYSATFLDAALNYLKAGGSPRYLGEYKGGEWTGLIGRLGHFKIREIDQEQLNDLAHEMYGHCTPDTQNRQFWTPFIAVWKHNTKGQKPLCPYVEWQRPKRNKSKTRSRKPCTYEDAISFINALSYPAAKVMFFLFWTGCRPLEAFDLETHSLNPECDWIALDETKTDMPRGIPMHKCIKPLMSFLKEQNNEHVFLNTLGKRYPSNRKYNKAGRIIYNSGGQMACPINSAKKRSGISITPYVARHTVSTYLIWPGGVSEMIKDEILGHASENEMSRHYTHLPRKSLIEAINQLPNPVGLRDDLTDPCKIRAQHDKTYKSNTTKSLTEKDFEAISQWL
ncbi:MAG: tyrosine-type recombinase/integrase [Reichenbachiella sp.]|uniref:tyrosine-type recombinase/integrase n=1 Tax=Reichenbachiella sp. TaxID=2184521 RepID=UPI0029674F8E|nr:tyrosine-type recombinase/integrase [Reichenbachiella sp.]MDW3210287.1 tyrosine-type recombinase/integrase [Reichenbachiella sp.]